MSIPAQKSTVLWAYFEPLPAGTLLTVELPKMFPFDKVPVTEGPSTAVSSTTAKSTPDGVVATIVSAKRADQALTVRLRLTPEKGVPIKLGSYFEYKNVFLFDPAAKRLYPMLKDTEGQFQGTPAPNANIGGFLANWTGTQLLTLNFPAPPDTVKSVDLILHHFLPIEGIAIEGLGGAAEGGVAAAGKTVGVEAALKDLGAKVTDTEIRIDLSADVLFDFDKATLKKDAEPSLQKVATVLKANPTAKVGIDGHTDGKGADAYNQTLSEAARRKRQAVARHRRRQRREHHDARLGQDEACRPQREAGRLRRSRGPCEEPARGDRRPQGRVNDRDRAAAVEHLWLWTWPEFGMALPDPELRRR